MERSMYHMGSTKRIKRNRPKDPRTFELLATIACAPDCTLTNAQAFWESPYGTSVQLTSYDKKQTHLEELLNIPKQAAKNRFTRMIYKLRRQGIIEMHNAGNRTVTLTPTGILLARTYMRKKRKEMHKSILS